MGVMRFKKFPEREIIKAWQLVLPKTGLVTEEGESIEILYPGMINDGQGADFRDAVIATERGLIKGDIEVHVRTTDWQNHQHQRNAAYNRAILHVVMWHNTKRATRLQNGREVPVLALDKYLKVPARLLPVLPDHRTTPNMPCSEVGQYIPSDKIIRFLERAGEERFFAKITQFKKDLVQMGAKQSLYQGIMGALGYSKNKLPFLKLAHRLPIQILESITQGSVSDEDLACCEMLSVRLSPPFFHLIGE
jgi:hypothetical protein